MILVAAISSFASCPPVAAVELEHWPPAVRQRLNSLIEQHAHSGAYAVFDMDNTLYRYDLTESLLPFLEMKGVLTRETLDPALLVVPFRDHGDHKESLNSYYYRLCEIDDMVSYPWIAQSFSGLTVAELTGYVHELMAYEGEIPIHYYDGKRMVEGTVSPPKILRGQVELVNKLRENGIEVYVVSAANEEAVRVIASSPQYGYNIKPENVLGVSLLLKNLDTGEVMTARSQIRAGRFDPSGNRSLVLTPHLWAPTTWMSGKAGAILEHISEVRQPILVAGDTPESDKYMLIHSTDIKRGGLRLWVNRKDDYMAQITQIRSQLAAEQAEAGVPVTADENWVVITPDQVQ